MGQFKKLLQDAIERGYAFSSDYDWREDMPNLTGAALWDAEAEFEADNLPLWIQLELDLWENQHGLGGECDL
jgi:hypothetical protein